MQILHGVISEALRYLDVWCRETLLICPKCALTVAILDSKSATWIRFVCFRILTTYQTHSILIEATNPIGKTKFTQWIHQKLKKKHYCLSEKPIAKKNLEKSIHTHTQIEKTQFFFKFSKFLKFSLFWGHSSPVWTRKNPKTYSICVVNNISLQ